jgi:hypothetical protein
VISKPDVELRLLLFISFLFLLHVWRASGVPTTDSPFAICKPL